MDDKPTREFLRGIPIFGDMNNRELERIIQAVQPVGYLAGDYVFRQGETGNGMYILERGLVEVRSEAENGLEVILAALGPGEVLGEMSLIDRRVRSASIVAKVRTQALWLPAEDFDAMRKELNPAAFKILRTISLLVCSRLRTINEEIGRVSRGEGLTEIVTPGSQSKSQTTPLSFAHDDEDDAALASRPVMTARKVETQAGFRGWVYKNLLRR